MGVAGAITGVAMGGMQLLQAKQQADALKRQSAFEAQNLEFTKDLVAIQRDEIPEKMQEDVTRRNEMTSQIIGAQKVALAAQGVEVDS